MSESEGDLDDEKDAGLIEVEHGENVLVRVDHSHAAQAVCQRSRHRSDHLLCQQHCRVMEVGR